MVPFPVIVIFVPGFISVSEPSTVKTYGDKVVPAPVTTTLGLGSMIVSEPSATAPSAALIT